MVRLYLAALLALCTAPRFHARPSGPRTTPPPFVSSTLLLQPLHIQRATEYLRTFGYTEEEEEEEDSNEKGSLSKALTKFQQESRLPASGEFDTATLEEMAKPRCTIIKPKLYPNRRKRFATAQTSRWDKLTSENVLKLKWYISHYTKDMPRSEIRSIVRKSFSMWSTQTTIHSMPSVTLLFEEAQRESDADITILWAEGEHGDAYKFDGPGNYTNILAHTFYPTYQETGTLNGDIHLDDFEKWIVDGKSDGTAFSNVLVHEIGHALGLGHSKRKDAIMHPVYKKELLEDVSFDLDDKCALNWNYIGPSNLCLFVWLMSEVLPRQIEHKTGAGVTNNIVSSSHHDKLSVHEKVVALKKQLRETEIPLCSDDNRVKKRFEVLLLKKLEFPPDQAEEYSDVVCNFFDGLQKQYRSGSDVSDDSEAVTLRVAQDYIRTRTQPLHGARRARRRLEGHKRRHRHHSPSSFVHREASIFSPEFFDGDFFKHFLTLYAQ